jgi:hypothetical protein
MSRPRTALLVVVAALGLLGVSRPEGEARAQPRQLLPSALMLGALVGAMAIRIAAAVTARKRHAVAS